MKYLLTLIFCLIAAVSKASIPSYVPLNQLVKFTDHVLTVHVVGVDMIDANGDKITKPEARTGPSLDNKIRLILKVDRVHHTTSKIVPGIIAAPLDAQLHYTLGQIKEAHKGDNTPFLALLEGSSFQPPFVGVFRREISSLDQILKTKDDLSKAGYKRPKIKPPAGSHIVYRMQENFKLLGLYNEPVDGVSNDAYLEVLRSLVEIIRSE